MRAWFKKWWPVLKALLALAIVGALGWQFARDLRSPALWQRSFHPAWFVLSAGLYILGFVFWATYWYGMLRRLGQHIAYGTALRAYFIGLMGKYLPGKAWALFLRAALVRGPGVRLGVAGYTALFEVLTTMSTGALVAFVLFAALLPEAPAGQREHIWRHLIRGESADNLAPERHGVLVFCAALFFGIGLPLLPAVFNRLVRRTAASLRPVVGAPREEDAAPLPHVRLTFVPVGSLLTGCGWLLWGASLWAALQGILDQPLPWRWDRLGLLTAALAFAYVAGFVILVVPSGIGVREFLLTLFLVPQLAEVLGPAGAEARPVAALAVVVLRLIWTAAEVVTSGLVYWLPGPPLHAGSRSPASQPSE
jgi:uncharacterized membrane protein YbhN (UPF0104 family)